MALEKDGRNLNARHTWVLERRTKVLGDVGIQAPERRIIPGFQGTPVSAHKRCPYLAPKSESGEVEAKLWKRRDKSMARPWQRPKKFRVEKCLP
jgi:hypothetical protein